MAILISLILMDVYISEGCMLVVNLRQTFSRYLFYVLLFNIHTHSFVNKAVSTGVKNLNIDRVASLYIAIPPLEEQKRIVAKVEELFALIDAMKK